MGKLLVLNIQYKLKHYYNLLHIDEFYLLLGEKFAFYVCTMYERQRGAFVLSVASAQRLTSRPEFETSKKQRNFNCISIKLKQQQANAREGLGRRASFLAELQRGVLPR